MMDWFRRKRPSPIELEEVELEKELVKEVAEADILLREIVDELKPQLRFIKIAFQRRNTMAFVQGPTTIVVGSSTVATVLGFDQFGQSFSPVPTPSYTIDNPALDTISADGTVPTNEDILSVAAGTANLTATVQGPNGPLSDTEVITNQAQAPVLSSIKIAFSPTGN